MFWFLKIPNAETIDCVAAGLRHSLIVTGDFYLTILHALLSETIRKQKMVRKKIKKTFLFV